MISLIGSFICSLWKLPIYCVAIFLSYHYAGVAGFLCFVVVVWGYKSYKALEYEPMVVNTEEDPETTEVDYDLTQPYVKRMRQIMRTYFKGFWIAFFIFVLGFTAIRGTIQSFKSVKKWALGQTNSLASRPYPGSLELHAHEGEDSTTTFETTPHKPESEESADLDTRRWL